MADHVAPPRRAASSARLAELHQLCREDYAKGQAQRAAARINPPYAPLSIAATVPTAEPTDLEVAIRVAQQLLDSDQILSVREALRLLLRALGAEPLTEEEAVRRAVDRAFPIVARFLTEKQGGGQ